MTYTFDPPARLRFARLRFDADLNRDTLPGDGVERKHVMRANRTPDSPSTHLPTTLVKSYALTAVTAAGDRINVAETEENVLGCVNIPLPDAPLASVSLTLRATWGGDPTAALFAFDVR